MRITVQSDVRMKAWRRYVFGHMHAPGPKEWGDTVLYSMLGLDKELDTVAEGLLVGLVI